MTASVVDAHEMEHGIAIGDRALLHVAQISLVLQIGIRQHDVTGQALAVIWLR